MGKAKDTPQTDNAGQAPEGVELSGEDASTLIRRLARKVHRLQDENTALRSQLLDYQIILEEQEPASA